MGFWMCFKFPKKPQVNKKNRLLFAIVDGLAEFG
jgi:hypothetical protein